MRCMCGVPADAAWYGASYDFPSRSILVAFEHPSFDPVDAGAESPSAPVVFEIIESPQRDLGMIIPVEIGTGPLWSDDYMRTK